MPGRFIGDNGLTLQLTKLIANQTSSDCIALILDQEKAYDRVHTTTYLRAVMQRFNISSTLTYTFDPFLRPIQQNPDFKGFDFHVEADLSPPSSTIDDLVTSFQQLLEISDIPENTDAHATNNSLPTSLPSLAVKILAYADDTLVYLREQC
ncbi:hypothetical protein [Parasitella parasitica]|uniref:Reverse transcriptase domain-containing protein n=1 Tax=Parasitella parasitica TaxID=35722 RepID=A0A0B7N1H6_9FUNG|nr:hypothetical protein [Parasitella parasitica]